MLKIKKYKLKESPKVPQKILEKASQVVDNLNILLTNGERKVFTENIFQCLRKWFIFEEENFECRENGVFSKTIAEKNNVEHSAIMKKVMELAKKEGTFTKLTESQIDELYMLIQAHTSNTDCFLVDKKEQNNKKEEEKKEEKSPTEGAEAMIKEEQSNDELVCKVVSSSKDQDSDKYIWLDELTVPSEVMNKQHKEIMEVFNKVASLLHKEGKPSNLELDNIYVHWTELRDLCSIHFDEEEEYIAKMSEDELDLNVVPSSKIGHRQILETISNTDIRDLSLKVLDDLVKDFTYHIILDKKIVKKKN